MTDTPTPDVGNPVDRARFVRDQLGRAHFERMRAAMGPHVKVRPWVDLTDAGRECYRRRTEYLVPIVLALMGGPR